MTAPRTTRDARSAWQALDALSATLPASDERENSGGERAGNTETVVVVPVGGIVPVAVRRAEPVRIVVPGTAAFADLTPFIAYCHTL